MKRNEAFELDVFLDEALSSYIPRTPRVGLERRVLHRIRVEGSTPARRLYPRWAVVASLVTCVSMALFAAWLHMSSRHIASLFGGSLLLDWCELLQTSWVGTSIRESTLVYPFIEGTHVLSLALMLGPAMMWDLRLAGVLWIRDPVSKVRKFLPITFAGFFVMVTTGSLLFWSEPLKCYHSVYFRIKIVLLVLSGLNALVFHSTIDRSIADWDTAMPPPPRARLAGILSLILWAGVIFAGRYTAYNLSM
jgi:hypothetical protein